MPRVFTLYFTRHHSSSLDYSSPLSIISSPSALIHFFRNLSHQSSSPALSLNHSHLSSLSHHSFLPPSPSISLIHSSLLLSLSIFLASFSLKFSPIISFLRTHPSFSPCIFTIPVHPPLTFTSPCMNNQNPFPHHPVDRNLPDRHPNPAIGETLYIRECEQRLVTAKQKYSDLVIGKIKPNPRDYSTLKAT